MSELLCERLSYPSADGQHISAGYIYTVSGVPVRAVLQLSHGMCEYVERYRPMAQWYAEHGIALAGNDHLGHGATAGAEDRGYYGEKNGRRHVLEDLHTMNGLIHERFPGLPVFLYGHSMGSFYARWYAVEWPETIDGVIISGTAGPSVTNRAGYLLAALIAAVRGEKYVSPLMVSMNFGSYCKRIEHPSSANDWLTRDAEVVRAYDADPLCTFRFTASTYGEMLGTLNTVSSRKWAKNFPQKLPVLFVAGDADPVGNYGAGVRKVWAMLGDAGVEDLTCQIWEGDRHELHNELNREEVFDYVLGWLELHLSKTASAEQQTAAAQSGNT